MQILQKHGIAAQTSLYPLALADIHGNMRKANKSDFLNLLKKVPQFLPAFLDSCPHLDQPSTYSDICVVVDFLYYVHIPPAPDVVSFLDYFTSLWSRIVQKYAITQNASKYT